MGNTQVTIFSGRKPQQHTNCQVKKKSHQDTVSFQLVKKYVERRLEGIILKY